MSQILCGNRLFVIKRNETEKREIEKIKMKKREKEKGQKRINKETKNK